MTTPITDRISTFDPNKLPDDARAVYDRILRERGYVPGPYRFWLTSPGFADRMEPVEEFLRYGAALDERQVEIVVLLVARHWGSQYVWSSHAPAAVSAGVEASVVEAIRTGVTPEFERATDATCYALGRALLENHAVGDPLWEEARGLLGEQRINEIIGLLGLYTSVCLTMVAYQTPSKDLEVKPLA